MQKKKSGVKKCLEILPLRGGGGGRLMVNAILNFHFDFPHTSLSFLSKEITEKLETECLLGSLTLRKRRKYANFHPVVVYARAVKVTAIACPFYHIVLFITLHSV